MMQIDRPNINDDTQANDLKMSDQTYSWRLGGL